MAEKLTITDEKSFILPIDVVKEIAGDRDVKTPDDFKNIISEFKNKPPEKVVEPYKFKDEYIENLVKDYELSGDISPYIESNRDYSKLSAEEIIRLEIKSENSGLSDAAINRLTKKSLDQYAVTEDMDDEEKELQRELLERRVKEVRDSLTEKSKKYKRPENPSVSLEKWAEEVNSHDVTKSIVNDKKITFKHGDSSFNFEVEPKSLVDMTIDNTNFFKLFVKPDKTTDFEKWFKVIAYAKNMEEIEKSLINHGQSLGAETAIKDLKNTGLGKRKIADAGGKDFLTVMAERGIKK